MRGKLAASRCIAGARHTIPQLIHKEVYGMRIKRFALALGAAVLLLFPFLALGVLAVCDFFSRTFCC